MGWQQILVPGFFAAAITLLLTPVALRLAHRLDAIDEPAGRKRHEAATPRLGGLAIVSGIVISLGPCLLLLSDESKRGLPESEIVWLVTAALIIFALGLADDIVGLDAFPKLLVQLVAASLVVGLGWQFSVLRMPWEGSFYVGAIGPLLSVLWIVGVTNAINFIDGLDGLAAGIVAIIGTSLLILAVVQRSPTMVIVTSCVVGSCVAFLRHNWAPARIYMGDSGSLTLGFILAAVSLRFSVKASAAVAILVPILALGLPVIDTLLVMWYRFLRGHRRTNRVAGVFHADRRHVHHLLLETQVETPKTTLTLYGLASAFCVMALAVAISRSPWLGLIFLAVAFVSVLVIRTAGLNAVARRLSRNKLERLELEAQADEAVPAADAAAAGVGAERRATGVEDSQAAVDKAKSATYHSAPDG